ncbi:MAG: hypothetical protein R3C26_12440 [Calditrichia bacterium]
MAAHPEGKSPDVSAPNFEKKKLRTNRQISNYFAGKIRVILSYSPRVQWANEHGFELITVEEIQSFEQETCCKPVRRS